MSNDKLGGTSPVYFWNADDGRYQQYLSQWYECLFKDSEGVEFNTTEKWMMYQKAVLFKDHETAQKIASMHSEIYLRSTHALVTQCCLKFILRPTANQTQKQALPLNAKSLAVRLKTLIARSGTNINLGLLKTETTTSSHRPPHTIRTQILSQSQARA